MCGDYFGWKILVYLKNSWKHQNENAFKEKNVLLDPSSSRWQPLAMWMFVFLNKS